ncbi:tetratricopeptide repeat protein [Deinococcus yavapaiensis]
MLRRDVKREEVTRTLSFTESSELARMLPEWADTERERDAKPLEPQQLVGVLARALLALAPDSPEARAPLVLFLDDAQWADASTLQTLRRLCVHVAASNAKVLILLTARAEGMAEASLLAAFSSDVGRELATSRLDLEPLDRHDTKRLLEAVAGREARADVEALGEQLFAETLGHPLYLVETLKGLLERGAISHDDEGMVLDAARIVEGLRAGAAGVRAVIGSRLARLSSSAVALAQASATLATAAEFEVLRAVADLGELEALDGFEALTHAGLLHETADGRLTLSHDRVRETVSELLGGPRRALLHKRALAVLERAGASPAALAHHALASGAHEVAAVHLERAGVHALNVGAFDEALRDFERALEVTQRRVPVALERRRALLTRIEFTLYLRDGHQLGALQDRWRRAARDARNSAATSEEAFALGALAASLASQGHHTQAGEAARASLDAARASGDAKTSARALGTLGRLAVERRDWTQAERWLHEAEREARSAGEEALALEARARLASVVTFGHDDPQAGRDIEEDVLRRRLELGETGPILASLVSLTYTCARLGDYAEALRLLDEWAVWSERAGNGRVDANVLGMRGMLWFEQDEVERALTAGEASLREFQKVNVVLPYSYAGLAACLARLGRIDEARRAFERGEALNALDEDLYHKAATAWALGDAALELGDFTRAESFYRQALSANSTAWLLVGLRGLGEVHARTGNEGDAVRLLGVVLARRAAGVHQHRRAKSALAHLGQADASDLLEAALALGRAADLESVVAHERSLGDRSARGRQD